MRADSGEVMRLRREKQLGPSAIARRLEIGRASVYASSANRLRSRRAGVSMPIRPEMRGFYPSNWPEISRRVRFDPKKVNVIVSSVGDTFANANDPKHRSPLSRRARG